MSFQPTYGTTSDYIRIRRNRNRHLLTTASNRTLWRSELIPVECFNVLPDKFGGNGLFYQGPVIIPRNRAILEYVGFVLSDEDFKKYYNDTNKLPTYVFELTYLRRKYYIDSGKYGNVSRFINHSCKNNNTIFKKLTERNERTAAIITTKEIYPGDEVLLNYGKEYFNKKDRICKCETCISCIFCLFSKFSLLIFNEHR